MSTVRSADPARSLPTTQGEWQQITQHIDSEIGVEINSDLSQVKFCSIPAKSVLSLFDQYSALPDAEFVSLLAKSKFASHAFVLREVSLPVELLPIPSDVFMEARALVDWVSPDRFYSNNVLVAILLWSNMKRRDLLKGTLITDDPQFGVNPWVRTALLSALGALIVRFFSALEETLNCFRHLIHPTKSASEVPKQSDICSHRFVLMSLLGFNSQSADCGSTIHRNCKCCLFTNRFPGSLWIPIAGRSKRCS